MSLYVEGDVPFVANSGNNGGMWGSDGIWAILLLALLGRGGFGGYGGGYGSTGEGSFGWQLGRLATTNDVASGFSTSEIMSDLNSIIVGQSNMQNWINQGFYGLDRTVLQGFNSVDNAICTLGYNLTGQIAQCCCDLKTMNLENRYLNEKQTCDIINAINAGNQRLVDIYTNDKIDTLNRKLATAEGQISQYAQTNAIVSALKQPCPIPSYIVPNPNCCYNACGGSTI